MTHPTTHHNWLSLKWPVVLFFLTVLSACDNADELPKPNIHTVRVESVTSPNSIIQRRFSGRIDALSTVDLSFQVAGNLIELPAQEGVLIKKGGLIAALDPNDFQLVVQQVKAQHHQNKLDVTRKRNLFKSGSLPKASLDQAETSYKLSRVALQSAQRSLSYTRITAPFDALVSKRYIDSFSNINAHQEIVRVQELAALTVKINIPEGMVKLLEQPEKFKAVAVFNNRPTQQFPLTYREHMTEAGSMAQTYEVSFDLSRKNNQYLLPGMTVTVIISKPVDEASYHVVIPVSAIDYDADGSARVWIFNQQTHTVTSRKITLGVVNIRKISVLSGLQAGEEIITAGAHLLREDMKVRRFTSF